MTAEISLMGADEMERWIRAIYVPFLDTANDDLTSWTNHLEVGRTWAATDSGRIVGTSSRSPGT